MSEPTIAPLAKQLAEENNVDWRVLQGSGSDGSIVEKDVLTFLAKVMAGEEALNPTAEPTPEGMEAWPEEDVKAFEAEQASSTDSAAPQEEVAWGDAAPSDASSPASEKLDEISFGDAPAPAPVASTPAANAPSSSGISSAEYQAALNEVERLKGEVQSLKSAQAQQSQAAGQVETLKSEKAQLESQVTKLQSEQSQLRSDLEKAKSAASGQSGLKDENEKVKAQLEKAKAEITRQRGVLEKAKGQIDGLKERLEEASQKKPWWKLFG